jgi:hypothetical protein
VKIRIPVWLLPLAAVACLPDLPTSPPAVGPPASRAEDVAAGTGVDWRPPPEEDCRLVVAVIPPIAGGEGRCWLQAKYKTTACGAAPPAWSVDPPDLYLEALVSCMRPVTPSNDGRGPCAYVRGPFTVFSVTATTEDGTRRKILLRARPDGCVAPAPGSSPPSRQAGS